MIEVLGWLILGIGIIAAGGVFYILKFQFPSYFGEKGKNLATIEDIGKITRKVEEVKTEFSKESEKLRSQLSIIGNVQIGLYSEERNAIVECNIKYCKWQQATLDTSFGGIDMYNDVEIDDYIRQLHHKYLDFVNSQAHLQLFVDDDEINQSLHIAALKTIETLCKLPIFRTVSN